MKQGQPHIAVIAFPGSNCERESLAALRRCGFAATEFLWNQPAETLRDFDGYFIVGGFSYEDRSRSGVIAAQDPILSLLREENAKGKGLLGICNGAQILVESGIVPGWKATQPQLALGPNLRLRNGHVVGTGFYNAWIRIAQPAGSEPSLFTLALQPGESLAIPSAHAEGRFICSDDTLSLLQSHHQIGFQYVDRQGAAAETFPENPNGSIAAIAGVLNPAGTALALMPHPERTPAGDPLFRSWHQALTQGWEGRRQKSPIEISSKADPLASEKKASAKWRWQIGSVLTDNTALSVTLALRTRGLLLKVERHVVWEVTPQTDSSLPAEETVCAAGDFFNSSKEFLLEGTALPEASVRWWVFPRAGMDPEGLVKADELNEAFPDAGPWEVRRGICWILSPIDQTLPNNWVDEVEATHLLANPLLHEISRE